MPPLPAEVREKLRIGGPGANAAGGPGDETGQGKVGVVETVPGSPAPEGAPAPAGTKVEDVKPKIEWESYNKARIEFNQDTFDYFRSRDPDTVAKSVKTQVAKDKKTGKTLGLKITSMGPNSPAEKFDVRPGDILVSIDGKPVESRSDAVNIIQGMSKDVSRVTVVIDRNGRKITYVIDPRDPKTRRAARYLEDR
jgi:S1-C subfamily serine protease